MTLKDLRAKDNLTKDENELLVLLEREEDIKQLAKDRIAKIKVKVAKTNSKIRKQRTHYLINVASKILEGKSFEEIENLSNLAKSDVESFKLELSKLINKI